MKSHHIFSIIGFNFFLFLACHGSEKSIQEKLTRLQNYNKICKKALITSLADVYINEQGKAPLITCLIDNPVEELVKKETYDAFEKLDPELQKDIKIVLTRNFFKDSPVPLESEEPDIVSMLLFTKFVRSPEKTAIELVRHKVTFGYLKD
ncbi:MAG TPA: hypothetical protein VEK38_04250 [Candidatus Bathyarchaeia archaeon]|nr:hypothetical protein [Candidatus Bathyarchaeia archaeon]